MAENDNANEVALTKSALLGAAQRATSNGNDGAHAAKLLVDAYCNLVATENNVNISKETK